MILSSEELNEIIQAAKQEDERTLQELMKVLENRVKEIVWEVLNEADAEGFFCQDHKSSRQLRKELKDLSMEPTKE